MPTASAERLDRLEERFAWVQRHLTEQDREILRLQEELARLRMELRLLQNRGAPSVVATDATAEMPDERPPHY